MENKKCALITGSKLTSIKGVTKCFRYLFTAKNPKKKAKEIAKKEGLAPGWKCKIQTLPIPFGEKYEFQKILKDILNK